MRGTNFPISSLAMYTTGNKYSSKSILGEELKKIHIILAELYDTCPLK